MLLSQGWKPGRLLGAVDAPHAHLHSDANASHIRVAVKDDNLGLGAKRGSGVNVGECTGLDVFQGLLGRLNGKSEVLLEKEQRSRDDLKRAVYTEQRWGALRFVSGGVLVGDKIEKLINDEKLRLAGAKKSSVAPRATMSTPKIAASTESSSNSTESSSAQSTTPAELVALEETTLCQVGEERRGRETQVQGQESDVDTTSDKAQRKSEKAQRKLDRRKRREEKIAPRAEQSLVVSLPNADLHLSGQVVGDEVEAIALKVEQPSITIAAAIIGGRQAVRQRYIRQKRMAMMDPKALNEVHNPHHSYTPTIAC